MLVVNTVMQLTLFSHKIDYIVIDSRGGYTAIIWPVQYLLSFYPDATIVVGNAMSAAAFLSVRMKNKRVIHKSGMLLFHKVFVTVKQTVQDEVALKVLNYILMRDAAKLLNMNYVDYKNKVLNNDWILLPEEALDRGIVSEIVDVKIDNGSK